MANEPITREEMLLNAVATGEAANLEPITREEMFLAKLGGADVTTPIPITRKEQFLQKAIENSGNAGGGGNTGSDEGWIGDGNTHLWIALHEGRTSPMLGVCPNGTVTVDWGDGTTPDVLTGTSVATVMWTPTHEYAEPGDYVITLTVDGEMGFYGDSSTNQGPAILRYSSSADGRNRVYQNALKKMEIGDDVTNIRDYAFYNCDGLANVAIFGVVTSVGNYAFYGCSGLLTAIVPKGMSATSSYTFSGCDNLASVTIPDGVTIISSYMFASCYSLLSVTIPDSVTSISTYAFQNCYGLAFYDFTNHTAVPTLRNTNAFSGIAADCEIRVPAALVDEWKAATNWATYASQIVGV